MYNACKDVEKKDGRKVDLILCCGDFESIRNENDLACMACPPKYREMVTFWKYYSGESIAPIPTIFIHGNHEASNYLMELPYGGWVAPNVYYMGFAGIVNFAGIRIAGFGGIFNRGNFHKGRYETCPLNDSTMRSLYHCREYEMFQMLQVRILAPPTFVRTSSKCHRSPMSCLICSSSLQVTSPIDIMLSHDWPVSAATKGDTRDLLRKKPFFKEDIERGELGNPAHDKLIDILKPSYWFSAHMHVKHAAVMGNEEECQHHHDAAAEEHFIPHDGKTRFLALDKIIPGRDFMQILDFPVRSEYLASETSESGSSSENVENSEIPKLGLVNSRFTLDYDVEWLSIIKSTQCFYPRETRANMPNRNNPVIFPKNIAFSTDATGVPRFDFRATQEELQEIRDLLNNDFKIPDNFIMVSAYRTATPQLLTFSLFMCIT